MTNGNSNLPHTWTQFIDILDHDPVVRDTLREAAKAKEVGPRAPAVLYLRAMADAGDTYFEILPEPWSDQDKKKHGDGTDVDADTVTAWNTNPRRYWDNYSYEVQGQKVTGSVYLDMVDRTEDGKTYLEFARLCADWNKDGDKTNLSSIGVFNGVQYDLENMAPGRRTDLKAMADGRRYTARDNLRIVVQIWRNIKDIEKHFAGICEVDFLFEENPDDAGNLVLERVKKPIQVWALQTIKEHPRFGQRTGAVFSCTSSQFANLAPRKCAAMENGKTLENLKRIKRKAAKAGAQPSTQEAGKAMVEGRISSNNAATIFTNLRIFVEEDGAKIALTKRLKEMKEEERKQFYFDLVETFNFFSDFITKDANRIHDEVKATVEAQALAELEAKDKATAEIAETEKQPTQNERNAEEWRQRELARQNTELSTPKPQPAASSIKVRGGAKRRTG